MENGGGNYLESKMKGLALNDSNNNNNNDNNNNINNDGLFQVIKAVEAAEATIKQQVEENNLLRSELQKKIQEIEKLKSGHLRAQSPHSVDQSDDHVHIPQRSHQIILDLGNQTDGIKSLDNQSHELSNSIVLQKNLMHNNEHHALQTHARNSAESNMVNGALRVLPGGQAAPDISGLFQLSSPFMTSFAPIRYQVEGESDRRLSLSGQGLMTIAEVNPSSLKQDLGLKVREHEEEIMHLKKHLAEYSMKEAQIRNEKHVLEKRIAYMRMAFDQQQQDLVDAASKAISYRQDIIEENIRLTYALQDAEQEGSTFISSLMPLLAEYSLQPPAANAQSIVSNVKVLFRHLHEKLMLTEAKLKESKYQISPWRTDLNTSKVTESPSHTTAMKDGLELVPQPPYSDGNLPISPDLQATTEWDLLGHGPNGFSVGGAKTSEPDELWRYSPLASRNNATQDVPAQPTVRRGNLHPARNEETISKQVTFHDLVSNSEIDDSDMERHQSDTEPSVTWVSKSLPYTTADEPSSLYSPYLPPVQEEPSSSFSEAADDDPLPAIEGLQISGEAFPGRELQACGYSINGTTSCNFEWVRHLEDGSFNYIDGAKQPNYLVTADDVDTYLAIEVQPLDNRKRKGELVKVFANDHRKITCDPEMHSCIQKTLQIGHASYKVSLSMGYLDMWEPATLSIKKEGYSIKPSGVVVSEKYSPSTIVSIPFGSLLEFSIVDSRGTERVLRAENNSTDVSCCRDTIVLTLRFFILRANVKKKSKKRGLFFTK